MRLPIMLALLVPTAAIGKEPVPSEDRHCAPVSRDARVVPSMPVGARPLGSEGPAVQMLSLYLSVDGCPTPIVLRKGLGMNAHRQQPITGEGERFYLRP